MEVDKIKLKGLLQYICDINEFGFEDDNIDSFEIWSSYARQLLDEIEGNELDD